MNRHIDYLLVGGGPAGATAAEVLRAEGAIGTILIISASSELPYQRPPLSKQFLLGRQEKEQLDIFPPDTYQKQKIEVLRNTLAMTVDPEAQIVKTNRNEKIHYGKLLIATGVRPVRLEIPGSEMQGIFYLRTIADALAIKAAMKSAKKTIIVGGNFIGLELASSFTQMGLEVKIILKGNALLDKLRTPAISEFLHIIMKRMVCKFFLAIQLINLSATAVCRGRLPLLGRHYPAIL
jgi:NADPH-dependent 2,4-dienoyl-CoA reductase/sulfur reductase-like enzyme